MQLRNIKMLKGIFNGKICRNLKKIFERKIFLNEYFSELNGKYCESSKLLKK